MREVNTCIHDRDLFEPCDDCDKAQGQQVRITKPQEGGTWLCSYAGCSGHPRSMGGDALACKKLEAK